MEKATTSHHGIMARNGGDGEILMTSSTTGAKNVSTATTRCIHYQAMTTSHTSDREIGGDDFCRSAEDRLTDARKHDAR